jgi:hypothetical protein
MLARLATYRSGAWIEAETDSKTLERTDYFEVHFNPTDWLKRVLD